MEINISPEKYEFLKQLMTRINTQDNLATATPFYYTVNTVREIAVPSETTDDLRYFYQECSYTEDELKKYCEENDQDFEDTKSDAAEYGVDYVQEYDNFFLTKEGYEEHMRLNGHNYRYSKEPARPYIKHAFRNPELMQLLDALGEITGLGHTKR